MPDYRMDIKGKLGLGEYSDIYDYMGIVDKNDNFTITLDTPNLAHICDTTAIITHNNKKIIAGCGKAFPTLSTVPRKPFFFLFSFIPYSS